MTLSALGIFSAAGAGVVSASSYELIETQILGSPSSSITFSSLGTYSSTYKHLQIRMIGRSNFSGNSSAVFVRLNGDTGSNYSLHELTGNAFGVVSLGAASQTVMSAGEFPAANYAANIFSPAVIELLDFSSSTKNTTIRTLSGISGLRTLVSLSSGLWNNTAAVTSVTVISGGGASFVAGTRMSIYGVK
jgi:hypothetical protein